MTDLRSRLQSALADRYTLERELGRGGMATVYLARDRASGEHSAVKVLHPELAASLGGQRFLREVELGTALRHPNIISVTDSGEGDGLLWYAMPFIEGESLRQRIDREGQLPIAEALRITREAARALATAHAEGVVHRDVKPENILLDGERVVVADFGVARAVTVAGGEKLTSTGMAVGTPVYMSPEQAAGSRDATPASDQYSLACVLYEMLTGQPPFTGPTAMSIMARHALDDVPRPSIVRGAIPPELEDAILCALEKVPADRFPSVEAFAAALDAPGATPRHARRAHGARHQRDRPAGRRRVLYASLGAAPLLLAALAGWRAWSARTGENLAAGPDAGRIAVLYLDHPARDTALATLADGLSEDLIGELRAVPTLSVISPNGVAPFRGRAVPADSVARALGVGAVVRGDVERRGGRVEVRLQLVSGATGRILERATVAQPAGADLLAVRDSIATRAAELVRRRLGREIELRETRARTTSVEAWSAAQQAEAYRHRADSLGARGDTLARRRAEDRADTLFALAARRDRRWPHPLVQRGWIAYWRSRRTARDPLLARPELGRGLGFAEAALARDSRDADALELRGSLRYWKWLLRLEPDARDAAALLDRAQADLEESKRLNPAQAGAWAMLSHLYNQRTGRETDVKIAAQRAYEADAYLANADAVLDRLFLASYDLEARTDAMQWCGEGERRFPANPSFVACRLWLLTMKGIAPDVPRAWRLADSLVALSPPAERAFRGLNGRMIVAAVLARAGRADSARRVAAAAAGDPEVDPARDLAIMRAFVSTLLGDRAAAIRSLKEYVAANPERRAGLAENAGGWWFRPLQADPDFLALLDARDSRD